MHALDLESLARDAFDPSSYDPDHPCDCEEPSLSVHCRGAYLDSEYLVASVVCDECKSELGNIRFSLALNQE